MHARSAAFLSFLALAFAGAATSLSPAARVRVPAAPPILDRLDAAIARGLAFLIAHQSEDGAWRSPVYGTFRDGTALTPLVVKALAYLNPASLPARRAIERGKRKLASWVREDGTIDAGSFGFPYPVYSASLAVLASARTGDPADDRVKDAFAAFLRGHQLDEHLGYGPSDPDYGGWGYAVLPSTRPDNASNLSSTLFAVGALRRAGVPSDDPAIRKALRFVERCQNFGGGGDGGFFMSPTDPARNKAGETAEPRFPSYGSMTADGLRALLACGLGPRNPRVTAARRWLEKRFTPVEIPGDFTEARRPLRNGYYHYYLWSATHAFVRLGSATLEGGIEWAAPVAERLLALQRSDGSWQNPITDGREDDPILATSLSIATLANARFFLGPVMK